MPVFDDAFVAKMHRKYDRIDLAQRPLVARIAAHEYWSDERAWIEETVPRLHPDDQAAMAHRLREKFISAYGELHIGHDLLRAGCTIRYDDEYQVDGGLLTPDWTAVFDGKTFVCDAFTAGLLDERKAFEDHVTALSARLSKIEAPYLVKVEVADEAGFTEAERKRITHAFSKAVRRGMAMGTVWRDDGCTIEILGPTADHVEVVTLDPMHLVRTPVSIGDTIAEKSRKYAVLGLPILVAAVPHPRAETNMVMFEDIVRGELVYKSIQMPDGKIIEGTARRTGAVFERRPELSAAMWRNPYTTHTEKAYAMFENDRAVHPLPRSFVERLRSLYPDEDTGRRLASEPFPPSS